MTFTRLLLFRCRPIGFVWILSFCQRVRDSAANRARGSDAELFIWCTFLFSISDREAGKPGSRPCHSHYGKTEIQLKNSWEISYTMSFLTQVSRLCVSQVSFEESGWCCKTSEPGLLKDPSRCFSSCKCLLFQYFHLNQRSRFAGRWILDRRHPRGRSRRTNCIQPCGKMEASRVEATQNGCDMQSNCTSAMTGPSNRFHQCYESSRAYPMVFCLFLQVAWKKLNCRKTGSCLFAAKCYSSCE